MKKKRQIRILLPTVLVMGLLAGCAQEKQSAITILEIQESVMEAEQTVTVVRGDIEVAGDLDAWVGPKIEQLSFEKDGYFGEFKVQLGDTVQKGDVLATPVMSEMEEAIEAKTRELDNLTVDYEYHKQTLDNQIAIAKLHLENIYEQLESAQYGTEEYTRLCISAGEYDEQRKRLELNEKQLTETYELELARCKKMLQEWKSKTTGNMIRAPFDGVVVALAYPEYGEAINTKDYYVAVADTSVVYARCAAVQVSTVRSAEQIQFWKDNKTYDAVFVQRDSKFYREMIGRGGDNFTEFEITLPQDEAEFGDYGLIHMVFRHKEDVLLLPETAIMSMSGNSYVYKQEGDKKTQVMIQTGYKDGIMVEIESGLQEGDVVYVQEN